MNNNLTPVAPTPPDTELDRPNTNETSVARPAVSHRVVMRQPNMTMIEQRIGSVQVIDFYKGRP